MTKLQFTVLVFMLSLGVLFTVPKIVKAQRDKSEAWAAEYTAALNAQNREEETARARKYQDISAILVFKERYYGLVADAIYWAEGGPDTRFPYGIKSAVVRSTPEARVVCLRTIENAFEVFRSAPKEMDFILFLGQRYCPESADPVGHVNWVKNVNYFVSNPKPLP